MARRAPLARLLLALVSALVVVAWFATPGSAAPPTGGNSVISAKHSLRSSVTDENFYFVMADRFENGDTANDTGGYPVGQPLVSGFDPTKKGFYNGGDLKGLLGKLDYIQNLGTDSIWLTPSFTNKPVQLEDGPSAGYHGYWVTDFTQIDPHLGTNADLQALVDAAHARGMKVYFDIITNHTADVIGYQEGARRPYISKDVSPYRDVNGTVFDDRDYATGEPPFPAMDPATSFPYHPVLDTNEESLKVPAWLNDVTLYHNRGDTTFVGENSQYGDFFGLDDLFTEHPRVVQGMIDIYETWIKNVGVDGFRIDTMKHVNDEFWQAFGPTVLQYAKDHGKPEFFMFGEVALDGYGPASKAFTSQYTTHNKMQSVLDFPFADAARDFASRSKATSSLDAFFANDDWYTDGDSNAYQLPTFLGNHDRGRIGQFIVSDNPGAGDDEWVARDKLAHELMYLSRGDPVVYYGDEQGFTGAPGGDQNARQTMFASQVPDYLDDDLLGTTRTHAQSNFEPSHPLYQAIASLADLTKDHPALRDGAQQSRTSGTASAGVYAFSRLDRTDGHEYVVALNNSESAADASFKTFVPNGSWTLLYGAGAATETTDGGRTMSVMVPALSAVVYRSDSVIPRSAAAPSIQLPTPAPADESRGRMHVSAAVNGSSFYEVTFYAQHGDAAWKAVGTDDSAPYQVYDDVSNDLPGTELKYRAVVLDNAGHTSVSGIQKALAPAPKLTIEVPAEGAKVRGTVEVRAVADPEKADHVVSFERSVAGGSFTSIGTDDTSPAYTVFDNVDQLNLAEGTPITYRATLHYAGGGTVTATRTVQMAGPPPTAAVLRYFRPAGDYGTSPDGWGLHMWGDAVDPAVLAQITWDHPWQRAGVDADGWARYEIPLVDATKPVNFIMHLPSGDTVPTTREPGGDRAFTPLENPEVWIVQGNPTVYTSKPTP